MASRRHLVIAGSVVLLHAAALWALQSGLLQRAVEVLVPVTLLSEFVEPPRPRVTPPPPAPKLPPPPQTVAPKVAALPPPPMPQAVAHAALTPQAPTGVTSPAAVLPPVTAPVAAAPAPVAAPPAPRVELPSSDADYLQNPKPSYPAMSRRLGEQGKVVVRVLIGVDGSAQQAEIRQSSGFDRLDQAALATTLRWRYVPGKRGGVAEAMWFNVPINFVLE